MCMGNSNPIGKELRLVPAPRRDDAADAGDSGDQRDARRHTVLIVDDQRVNLMVLGEVLQPHYRVRAASSARSALEIARSHPRPDLIMLDIRMPDMDGYEVLRELRADAATRDIPVIFVTSMDSKLDEETGLALGAVDYIAKPVRPNIVLARVRTQIELKQARDLLKRHNTVLTAD